MCALDGMHARYWCCNGNRARGSWRQYYNDSGIVACLIVLRTTCLTQCSKRSEAISDTQGTVEALGRKCTSIVADLSSRDTVRSLVPKITSAQDQCIDILVNNAGIMRRHDAVDFPEEDLDEVMEVNFASTFLLCQAIGRYWIDNKIPGRLINTASLATFQGGVRMAAYSGSKGAVGQLTKALSNEWAQYGIRVNAIAPGYIATDMNIDTRTNVDTNYYDSITSRIPAGHWGEPKDFKGPVVFLASEASSYITGETIVVS